MTTSQPTTRSMRSSFRRATMSLQRSTKTEYPEEDSPPNGSKSRVLLNRLRRFQSSGGWSTSSAPIKCKGMTTVLPSVESKREAKFFWSSHLAKHQPRKRQVFPAEPKPEKEAFAFAGHDTSTVFPDYVADVDLLDPSDLFNVFVTDMPLNKSPHQPQSQQLVQQHITRSAPPSPTFGTASQVLTKKRSSDDVLLLSTSDWDDDCGDSPRKQPKRRRRHSGRNAEFQNDSDFLVNFLLDDNTFGDITRDPVNLWSQNT